MTLDTQSLELLNNHGSVHSQFASELPQVLQSLLLFILNLLLVKLICACKLEFELELGILLLLIAHVLM
jgi:hypothetical protein